MGATRGKLYRADEIKMGDIVLRPGVRDKAVVQVGRVGDLVRIWYANGYTDSPPTALMRAVRPRSRVENLDISTRLVHTTATPARGARQSA